jgi:hypothetical protein
VSGLTKSSKFSSTDLFLFMIVIVVSVDQLTHNETDNDNEGGHDDRRQCGG